MKKRVLAIALILTMLLSMAACGADSSGGDFSNIPANTENDWVPESTGNTETDNTASGDGMAKQSELTDPELRYVMIYNPKVYDENAGYDRSSLAAGTLGSQIDVFANRADELETEPEYKSVSQNEWTKYFSEDAKLDDNRADPMGIDYKQGDKQKFYFSGNGELENRQQQEFTCNYAGQYCYVWSMGNDLDADTISAFGQEFDQKIYKEVAGTFGTPRFVGETGKVNILLYDMQGGLLGYFALPDLFVESEHASVGLEDMTCNTGHAIININAILLKSKDYWSLAYSTTAHELQHLINFSAFFSTSAGVWMNTWLNEAMSGYIEEELYSGAKEEAGHYQAYNGSEAIRNGQSLYNFENDGYDIGVYGSVYYLSKYLENIAGKDIFSDMMDYWRDSYSFTLSTAEALAESVSENVYKEIDESIDFAPLNISFGSEEEEWMSKLCLNFYLSTLSNDRNIQAFNNIKREALLYDTLDSADIQGGGRLIVALSGDSFEVPEDSDSGLIYIGLDKDFKPITNFIYQ